jgi:hypothetical protein
MGSEQPADIAIVLAMRSLELLYVLVPPAELVRPERSEADRCSCCSKTGIYREAEKHHTFE